MQRTRSTARRPSGTASCSDRPMSPGAGIFIWCNSHHLTGNGACSRGASSCGGEWWRFGSAAGCRQFDPRIRRPAPARPGTNRRYRLAKEPKLFADSRIWLKYFPWVRHSGLRHHNLGRIQWFYRPARVWMDSRGPRIQRRWEAATRCQWGTIRANLGKREFQVWCGWDR